VFGTFSFSCKFSEEKVWIYKLSCWASERGREEKKWGTSRVFAKRELRLERKESQSTSSPEGSMLQKNRERKIAHYQEKKNNNILKLHRLFKNNCNVLSSLNNFLPCGTFHKHWFFFDFSLVELNFLLLYLSYIHTHTYTHTHKSSEM